MDANEAAKEVGKEAGQEAENKIMLVLHYGGRWSHFWENEEDEEMEYIGGEAGILEKPNMDKLRYFYLAELGNQLGFNWGCRMWYKTGQIKGKMRFEEIKKDDNIADMLFLNSGQKDMHVYYVPIPPPCVIVDTELIPFQEEEEEVGGSANKDPLQTEKEANVCLALVPYESKVVESDNEVPREEDKQQDEGVDEIKPQSHFTNRLFSPDFVEL